MGACFCRVLVVESGHLKAGSVLAMEMWKVSFLGRDGDIYEFVNTRDCCREYLAYYLDRRFVECCTVWCKTVNCVDNLRNWDFCDIFCIGYWQRGYRDSRENFRWERWERTLSWGGGPYLGG